MPASIVLLNHKGDEKLLLAHVSCESEHFTFYHLSSCNNRNASATEQSSCCEAGTLLKNRDITTFYVTRCFITVFGTACYLSRY